MSESPTDRFLRRLEKDLDKGKLKAASEYLSTDASASESLVEACLQALNRHLLRGPHDDYKIIKELGRGAQGVVYLADDLRLQRKVALKVLLGFGADAHDALARFDREAATAARIQDPGICTVYEAGVNKGAPFIAMEYVEGRTLRALIDEAHSLETDDISTFVNTPASTEQRAASKTTTENTGSGSSVDREAISGLLLTFERAARSLHAAHEAGIIHRDIKPGNIMVRPDGVPVILDFGLARTQDGSDPTLTRTGDMFGTPAYMSPEQLTRNTIHLDRRTDIYSLGVSLYEALGGRRPFESPTREALYSAILTKRAPDLRRFNTRVSADLAVVVETALSKDRDTRYQTAEDLAEDLRRVRAHEPIKARLPGLHLRFLRWVQREPALAMAVIGIFLLLVAGLAGSAWALAKQRDLNYEIQERSLLAERRLADWQRMSDVRLLQDLIADSAEMWPLWADDLPKLDDWLMRAEALEQRAPDHRDWLSKADREVPTSDTLLSRWQRGTMRRFLEDLDTFLGTDGELATARTRRQIALQVQEVSASAASGSWAEAAADVSADARFAGFSLRRQPGLVPLGKDPESDLWEFADLQTGLLPERDTETGRLKIEAETGVVFVLVPAGAGSEAYWWRPREGRGPEIRDIEANIFDLIDDLQSVWQRTLMLLEQDIAEPVRATSRVEPFLMSKYELTQSQWLRMSGRNPSVFRPKSEFDVETTLLHPVENVAWSAIEPVLARYGMRLPRCAEMLRSMEKGADEEIRERENLFDVSGADKIFTLTTPRDQKRKGALAAFDRRKDITELKLFLAGHSDGHAVHAPVGSFEANPLGLHDIEGNVAEWCADSFIGGAVDGESGVRPGLRPLRILEVLGEDMPLLSETALKAAGTILADFRTFMGGSFAHPDFIASLRIPAPMHRDVTFFFMGFRPARSVLR